MTYRRRSRCLRLRRGRKLTGKDLAAPAVAALLLAAGVHAAAHSSTAQASAQGPSASVAAQVISYAQAQLGCPYVWGGTGPCSSGYDCSGLAMEAYQSAGITIERTSQAQWSSEQQVATPAPGDLVFFAGADGTDTSPGHVGIVVDPATHTMIDAYASGLPVEYDTYGLATSAEGLSDPVGFTDPMAGGS